MHRVLLIDDNPIFRLGMRQLLKDIQPDLEVIERDSYLQARTFLREHPGLSLIMLDMSVSDSGGFVGLFQLRSEFPKIPVIILSSNIHAESVSRAVGFGAAGYIHKSAPCESITHTLKAALSGQSFNTMPIAADARQVNPIASLSPAQLRVLMGLKKGLRNKEIAFELGLTEKTIKAYMSTLYRRLGVSNRTQALIMVQGMSLDVPNQTPAAAE